MADIKSLQHALPEYINLHNLADIRDEYRDLAADDPELWGDEWDSIRALVEAVEDQRDVDEVSRHGGVLIARDHFVDYCREFAQECGDIREDSPMESYVDWKRYARDCEMDYTEIEVESGEFAGTWLIRD